MIDNKRTDQSVLEHVEMIHTMVSLMLQGSDQVDRITEAILIEGYEEVTKLKTNNRVKIIKCLINAFKHHVTFALLSDKILRTDKTANNKKSRTNLFGQEDRSINNEDLLLQPISMVIFILKHKNGYSYREIKKLLGLNRQQIADHILSAKKYIIATQLTNTEQQKLSA